jgi:FAD/FMN-containing dehydrogenase
MESGAKNSEVYDLIGSNGYAFPGGTCPTVGVSGFTLGGGWGFSRRLLGLGCESLIELEVVDYQGKLIKANQYCHPDLFWGCRGAGGGNFGVVVGMTFQLPEPAEVMDVWQNWRRILISG